MYTATYDPADNKLRLYSMGRLPADIYTRVRAAGFIYAPKQELFVAPSWSPSREDLLVELCGEIGDEDTSLVDRAEQRAERFEDYSEKRATDAERASAAVKQLADGIPLGQPILIGHHSEKHARKDAERIENGMRKAVKMWETSKYWTRRASGAISHAKYKERPDVRHRRIKGIESDKRKTEKTLAEAIKRYNAWVKISAMEGADILLPEEAQEMNGAQKFAYMIANYHSHWTAQHPTSHEANKKALEIWHHGFSAYDFLTKKEFIGCPFETLTPKQVADLYLQTTKDPSTPGTYTHRWIQHFDNRLAYERAMLGESGDPAEKWPLEVGGRVLVRGEWVTILKINKVGGKINSVTTNAQYVSKKGVEEIRDYEAPSAEVAETVKAAVKLPPICNYPGPGTVEMTKAQWTDTYSSSKGTRIIEDATTGRHRRKIVMGHIARKHGFTGDNKQWDWIPVFVTDEKRKDPPTPGTEPKPTIPARERAVKIENKPLSDTETTKETPEPMKNEIQAMRDTLRAGISVVSAPQLFPTPPDIAAYMVELAEIEPGQTVLEPSAGTGNLIIAAGDQAGKIIAVEKINALAEGLNRRFDDGSVTVHCADFLSLNGELGTFDRIIMNPPFENGSDIKHIRHAFSKLNPGGKLVALCANGPRQREAFQDQAEYWEDLPAGSFKSQGTGVNVALMILTKPL